MRQRLQQHTAQLRQDGLLRQRTLLDTTLNFSSNDYLSLLLDSNVQRAYQQGFARYAVGSGSSMVVCGYHPMHQALEAAFAKALGVDDCLIFSSGYAANLSVMNLLARFEAHVLIDKAAHASIYDGLQLSGARFTRYRHHDFADLTAKLHQATTPAVLMTESIFSMSGHMAPLGAIVPLAQSYQCDVIVDEAHAFGIMGPEGLGAVVDAHLTQTEIPLRVIPLGKAFAACGAIVAGQGVWIEALLQAARSHIYSTAISPAFAYGLMATLEVVRQADERRAKLANLVSYFRDAIQQSPLQWRDSVSPIQQLQVGCPHQALAHAVQLQKQGIVCLPMRQPTVTKPETGLRVILNYQHEPEDIDHLFNCLHAL